MVLGKFHSSSPRNTSIAGAISKFRHCINTSKGGGAEMHVVDLMETLKLSHFPADSWGHEVDEE